MRSISPVPVRAGEFGFVRQVLQPHLASALSFSTPRLNLVLTHGSFSRSHRQCPSNCQPSSGCFRVYQITQLRNAGIHHRKSAGTRPVVLKVTRVMIAAYPDTPVD